jgi:small subunit ribosomal protein S20
MANLKTSIKDLRKNKRRSEFNKRIRNRTKKAVKNFETLVSAEEVDKKKAEDALQKAYKILDKAAQKKVIKKNTASRKKSRLATKLNKLAQDNVKSSKKGA